MARSTSTSRRGEASPAPVTQPLIPVRSSLARRFGAVTQETPFGRDLVARGLNQPALVVADGAPGLWKAARELWPGADEQRCTVHALRNVTAKLPERHHREVKARWWKAFDEGSSPAEARRGLEGIVADYRSAYPSAMAVIERDLDGLVAHLRWPSEHRKRIPRSALRAAQLKRAFRARDSESDLCAATLRCRELSAEMAEARRSGPGGVRSDWRRLVRELADLYEALEELPRDPRQLPSWLPEPARP